MNIVPLEELIFGIAFVAVFAILQLPYKDIDGNSVPTVVFTDKPSLFHGFLLALNFAFTGAVMTISLRERYPKIARYCRGLAVVSIVGAVGVLVWLAFLSSTCMEHISNLNSYRYTS